LNRKEFLITCGAVFAGGTILSSLLQGCSTIKIVPGNLSGSDLFVPLESFEIKKESTETSGNVIIVRNEKLSYPICIYRLDDNNYSALLMKCTHQGTELQVFGKKLQCPAHGSEFDKHGSVTNGPASSHLRVFPVIIENKQLKISLK